MARRPTRSLPSPGRVFDATDDDLDLGDAVAEFERSESFRGPSVPRGPSPYLDVNPVRVGPLIEDPTRSNRRISRVVRPARFARPPMRRRPFYASRSKPLVSYLRKARALVRVVQHPQAAVRRCLARYIRKQILFARKVAGYRRSPGRGGSYRRNNFSQYRCW